MGIVPDNRGKKYKTHDQEMIKRLASTMCTYEEIGYIIGMTGEGGGRMASLCDVLIDVPSRSTPRIQEMHLVIYHFLCEQIELALA